MISGSKRHSNIAFALVAMLTIVGTACSDDEPPKAAVGEACEVDKDCESGLLCRAQVCVESGVMPDAGDMGRMDGGEDDMSQPPIEDESYFVSYVLTNINDETNLYLHDSDDETSEDDVRVNPDSIDCTLGCFLSEDLSNFIWVTGAGTFDIHKAPVSNTFEVDLAGEEILATGVRGAEVIGDIVTYLKTEGEDNIAYFRPIDGGNEQTIGRIGRTAATEGDWFLDPTADKAVVYTATLQTMDVKIGSLGEVIDSTTFTIDSQNYQQVSGSYFGGNVPTAISRDGRYMALLTDSAPMDYNACSSEADCTGVGQRCGRFDRCSAIQVVVHFFDLSQESLDQLGEACSADEACGPVHKCDIPAPDQIDEATCIPRRVVLGLPGDRTQQGMTGCELTEGNQDLFYTKVRGPLTFGSDGSLYAVGGRDCGEFNIEQTRIIRLHPESDEVEVVMGNPGANFDESKCFDSNEQSYLDDNPECVVYHDKARLSPKGNDLLFTATNLRTTDPALAARDLDLWAARRDGTDRTWFGRHSTFDQEIVTKFWVHPK